MVSFIGPYSCLLFKVQICNACADCGPLCVIQGAAEQPDGFQNEITQ
jgi:hypothetical protein